MNEVWITGVGVVSALGRGLDRHASAARAGQSGLVQKAFFDGRRPDPVLCGLLPQGLLDGDFEAGANERGTRLLEMAMDDALSMAGLGPEVPIERVVGTTMGNLHGGTLYVQRMRRGEKPDLELVRDFLLCAPLRRAAREHGLRGEEVTVSSACGSAAAALGWGFRLVGTGQSPRVLAGGFDALCPYVVAGFHSLGLVSAGPCRPFDRGRDGLNPGEGAVLMVLEEARAARERGVWPLGRLAGFGEALEAFHHTRSHPEGRGVAEAMERALAVAGIGPEAVSALHLHGTGTRANDLSEAAACRRVFGERLARLPACSTKPMTGHTFGPSGALTALFALTTLGDGWLPGTLNLVEQDPETRPLDLSPEPRLLDGADHMLVSCLGFGGESFALLLSRAGDPDPGEWNKIHKGGLYGELSENNKNNLNCLNELTSSSGNRAIHSKTEIHIQSSQTEPVVAILGVGAVHAVGGALGDGAADRIPLPSGLGSREARKLSRQSRFCLYAADQAWQQAGYQGQDAGLLVGMTQGSTSLFTTFHEYLFEFGPEAVSPNAFSGGVAGAPLGAVSAHLGLTLGGTTLVGYEACGLQVLNLATRAVSDGFYPRCLVGACEEHSPVTRAIYGRCGWFGGDRPPTLPFPRPEAGPGPGFAMGEGAVFLALGPASEAGRRPDALLYRPLPSLEALDGPVDLVVSGAGGGPQDAVELTALLALFERWPGAALLFPSTERGTTFAAGPLFGVALATTLIRGGERPVFHAPAPSLCALVGPPPDPTAVRRVLLVAGDREGQVQMGLLVRS